MKILSLILASACFFPVSVFANSPGLARPPSAAFARMAPPEPPQDNPHPPENAADKRRVDFAVLEIQNYYGPGVEIRHPHIIPWSMENFQKSRQKAPAQGPQDPNVIVEAQAGEAAPPSDMAPVPVMGPALQADEYMVHVYARFKGDPTWYHLDVIMTEDAQGRLARRRFFRIPMPPTHGQLPPGVVC